MFGTRPPTGFGSFVADKWMSLRNEAQRVSVGGSGFVMARPLGVGGFGASERSAGRVSSPSSGGFGASARGEAKASAISASVPNHPLQPTGAGVARCEALARCAPAAERGVRHSPADKIRLIYR